MKNRFICNFAVVRFLPYPETEEFVNIGVVLACPQTGLFDYTLEKRRRDRITHFFPEMEYPHHRPDEVWYFEADEPNHVEAIDGWIETKSV